MINKLQVVLMGQDFIKLSEQHVTEMTNLMNNMGEGKARTHMQQSIDNVKKDIENFKRELEEIIKG